MCILKEHIKSLLKICLPKPYSLPKTSLTGESLGVGRTPASTWPTTCPITSFTSVASLAKCIQAGEPERERGTVSSPTAQLGEQSRVLVAVRMNMNRSQVSQFVDGRVIGKSK